VTPHIAKDDMIRLHIVPVFSVHVDDVDITIETTGGGSRTTPQPVVDTREADTIALIQSGKTVVIGGLRKQTVNKAISKIPLLGDLPLLGGLFRFEGDEVVNSELVVFITPTIVEQPLLSATEKKELDDTNFTTPTSPTTVLEQ